MCVRVCLSWHQILRLSLCHCSHFDLHHDLGCLTVLIENTVTRFIMIVLLLYISSTIFLLIFLRCAALCCCNYANVTNVESKKFCCFFFFFFCSSTPGHVSLKRKREKLLPVLSVKLLEQPKQTSWKWWCHSPAPSVTTTADNSNNILCCFNFHSQQAAKRVIELLLDFRFSSCLTGRWSEKPKRWRLQWTLTFLIPAWSSDGDSHFFS